MQKLTYVIWAAWLVAGVVLKIMGLVDWWAATSALWFPLGAFFSISAVTMLIAEVGQRLKERRESKIPPSCENCLFGRVSAQVGRLNPDGDVRCVGEKHGHKRGEICEYYSK